MYAEANGTLLTVTTFREPVSHIMSTYRMWPPSRRCHSTVECPTLSTGKHAVPLPHWLPKAEGLQAGSLTLDSWPHLRKGFHNLKGCAVLSEGRNRLASFDAVGVMDCMNGFLNALCHAMSWPCEADRERLRLALQQALRHKPHGVSPGGTMMREARSWGTLGNLNATIRERIVATARCDQTMYEDAVRQIGLLPPTIPGEALDHRLCASAVYRFKQRRDAIVIPVKASV